MADAEEPEPVPETTEVEPETAEPEPTEEGVPPEGEEQDDARAVLGLSPRPAPEPETAAPAEQAADEDDMESGFAALEMCTSDDTEPAPAEILEQLGEAAEGLGGDEAAQLAEWLSARLGADSIPIVLKTLQLVGMMLDSAAESKNTELREAFATHCGDAVADATGFDKLDPEHGERPAQLIRKVAAGVRAKLTDGGGADEPAEDSEPTGDRPRKDPFHPHRNLTPGDTSERLLVITGGTVVGLYGDQSADDLFELALQRRR